jgi:tetratricopeptide (TPR) repeat protein
VEADLLSRHATVMAIAKQHREAIAPARRALALRAARLPADSLEMADAHNTLGWVLARDNQSDEARQHLERALQIRRQRLGPEHLDLAGTLHNLGMLESHLDRQPAAEGQFRAALAIKRRTLPPRHPSVLNSVQSLASALGQQRKTDEAIALLQDLVAARRDINGPDSVYTGYAEHELAVVERDAGMTTQALAHYRHSMQIAVKQSGPRSVSVAISLNNIAGAEESLGDPAAEPDYRESLAIRRERLAAGDVGIARAEAALGRWLLNNGRIGNAASRRRSARRTQSGSHIQPAWGLHLRPSPRPASATAARASEAGSGTALMLARRKPLSQNVELGP